jgi:hypothetical protein
VGGLRYAMLDPKYQAFYPKLPAGRWLPAWQTTLHQSERLWQGGRLDALLGGRVLLDRHFRFRGGTPRKPGWKPERLSGPNPAAVRKADR